MRLHDILRAGFAAAGVGLVAAPAAAQPGFNPPTGYNPNAGFLNRNNIPSIYGVNPYRGAIDPYQFGYARSFGFNVYNPVTGGQTVFQYTQSQPFGGAVLDVGGAGLPGFSARVHQQVNPYLYTAGGYASGPNPIAVEQARLAAQGGRGRNGVAPAAPPGGAGQPAGFAAVPPPAPAPAAPADKVRSGEALNALVVDLGKLLDGGAKSDAPLFPADLLAQVRYQPGVAADLLAALRDGPPEMPAALGTPAFTVLRSELQPLVDAVVTPVLAGKKPDPVAADRLTARTVKARTEADAVLKGAAAADTEAVARYLAGLDTLAAVSKNPDLAGVYSPAFASIGATATELVKYARLHKLKFAPATEGGEGAYQALYRGLATYKQALESGK